MQKFIDLDSLKKSKTEIPKWNDFLPLLHCWNDILKFRYNKNKLRANISPELKKSDYKVISVECTKEFILAVIRKDDNNKKFLGSPSLSFSSQELIVLDKILFLFELDIDTIITNTWKENEK